MFDIRQEDHTKTILAFDYGDVRIGVAIKPAGQSAVEPLITLQNNDLVFRQVGDLIALHNPSLIVVGRPRNLEGESTQQTQKAERFAQGLQEIYNDKVVLQDEALSTQEARSRIPKQFAAQARQYVDQYAACIILEDYLKEE